ncbi:MAG TPA: hypothetical protein VM032_04685 [Vicinamibacterales bacterium]|nr:hypothetical protein [Vicinamibacterales bacterium]
MTRLNSKLLAIPAIGRQATVWVAFCLAIVGASGHSGLALVQDPATTAERENALKAFTERVNQYTELKKKLAEGMPKMKPGDAGTGKTDAHEDTLAARIQGARKAARRGDIFGDAGPYFTRIIERDSQTRGIRDAYNAMQEVPVQSPPAVNAIYPEKAALATVPPMILVNLPRLPDGIEYRFMGRDLILRDREANLIVDFLPGAVPALKP